MSPSASNAPRASDLTPEVWRGSSRLAIEAVLGVTDIVEAMHASIAGLAPIVGQARRQRARGISGLVYNSVRGVTRLVGGGLDRTYSLLPAIPLSPAAALRRETLLAQLNGVIGDHLEHSANPLAIPMRLRAQGQPLILTRDALIERFPAAAPRLMVMVHGLCMNDLQWQRQGHDHAAALAASLGYTPIYLHYNTGRRISRNGEDFAELLTTLAQTWPQPIEELVLVGHSMGGLVIRSALAKAAEARQAWLAQVTKAVFLGTPHHGAPLERAGNLLNRLLDSSPYSAPIGRLGALRSAGIQDLRFGNIVEQDWADIDPRHPHDTRRPVKLPEHVAGLNIAATRSPAPDKPFEQLKSDGLVSLESALGRHAEARVSPVPEIPDSLVIYGIHHLDLLQSRQAFCHVNQWLSTSGH